MPCGGEMVHFRRVVRELEAWEEQFILDERNRDESCTFLLPA
jgi:hypothetical protein